VGRVGSLKKEAGWDLGGGDHDGRETSQARRFPLSVVFVNMNGREDYLKI
jgi:hypothetical protein